MSIKSFLAVRFAEYIKKRESRWIENPIKTQEKVFKSLVRSAKNTLFGKEHHFSKIRCYEDFKKYVPVNDYENSKPYIEKIRTGAKNILWKGKPLYFAKTSGTTSGVKYIPITKESIPQHIKAARNALLFYIAEKKDASFVDGKMIFLQGSPVLKEVNGIKIGRLSGIAAHYVPKYLLKNRLPSWKTNCIEDWETKVHKIVQETLPENMSVISGIPSWVQMYFEILIFKTGKSIKDLFPNFNFFIHGGVNFEPYKKNFEALVGKKLDYIELYPASEGFIAFQDSQEAEGMLLQLNAGIFYEFIPADEFYDDLPRRISLRDVKVGVHYVILLNTNAGLWGYTIGDTVRFTSTNPYRVQVTGRIKHFISAFGEHVIGKEVEQALHEALQQSNARITEFTVAPQVNPEQGLPYHQWYIEFEKEPDDLENFARKIDLSMQKQNIYYKDLIQGSILRTLIISKVKKGGFHAYMKSVGKLGGQNKIPQLSNERKIVDILDGFLLK